MDKIRRSSFILLLIFVATGVFYGVLSSEVSAENISMSATINPSMTLNIDNTSPSISVTPSSSGTFSSTNIQVGIYSNGYIGYNLMMTPASSNLTGTTNSDNIIPTLENTSDCAGGTACSSNAFAPGHWGIAIDEGNYSPAAATELVSIQNSDSSTNINEYEIYLGANLDLTTALDNYTTTITFAATPTIKTYNVTFNLDSNISSIVIDGPGVSDKTISYGDDEDSRTVQLYYATSYYIAVNAKRGYDGDITIIDGSGSINNGVFTVGTSNSVVGITGREYTFADAFSEAGKTMKETTNGNYYKMQDMDSTICSAVSNEQEDQLIDDRDDKVYWVAKLKDGRCWMTQNLDHDIDSSKIYTPADTDILRNWEPESFANTHVTGDTEWIDGNYHGPESYDPGDVCWNGTPDNDATVPCDDAGANMHYHLGNYYNWTAAVAMNDSSDYTTQYQDANQSICPAGWMLPKSGHPQTDSGSFWRLISRQGLTIGMDGNIQLAPAFFIYGGYWAGESVSFGDTGLYWSSAVVYSSDSYALMFYVTNANPDYLWNDTRSLGFSVRCVSR